MKDIAIVIVNYRTPELVVNCVTSVLAQEDVRFEVIVVDNNSGDDSVLKLREFGAKIKLIANTENCGFGAACNQGVKASDSRFIFFLNPDATLLTKQDLLHTIQFMNEYPEFGLVGTAIVDSADVLQTTAWDHYPRQDQSGINFSHLPGEIATVLGASMIVRREAFQKVGGFDEAFFLYAEETDLCLRLRKQGYMIGYCENVVVKHVGGASEAKAPAPEVVRRKKSAKYLFYRKHYSEKGLMSILRHDLNHSRLNLWKLRLKSLFCRLSGSQSNKLARHRVTFELAKAAIDDI